MASAPAGDAPERNFLPDQFQFSHDFCHFVLEALNCSRKGKLTVAFALLRKPLQENLLYLEWLLADPEDFVNAFYKEAPRRLIEKRGRRVSERVIEIIGGAINPILGPEGLSATWQHELRFDRVCSHSFEPLGNKALHLVTTKGGVETERQNFNFIFSDDACWQTQWEQIYHGLPLVLMHAVEVCDTLMVLILGEPLPDYAEESLHRTLGVCLHNHLLSRSETASPQFSGVDLACPRCRADVPPDEETTLELFQNRCLPCPECGAVVTVAEFSATPGIEDVGPSG